MGRRVVPWVLIGSELAAYKHLVELLEIKQTCSRNLSLSLSVLYPLNNPEEQKGQKVKLTTPNRDSVKMSE